MVVSTVSEKHPQYLELEPSWIQLADTWAGEHRIRERGTVYLPPTSGMVLDGLGVGQKGAQDYERYRSRAVYWHLLQSAIETLVGALHREEDLITLPPALEPLRQNALPTGESLQLLRRKLSFHQLLYGRVGLLVEIPDGQRAGDTLPLLVPFEARSIINWDAGPRRNQLQMVVLDETGYERTPEQFSWELVERHRVLRLTEQGTYVVQLYQTNATTAAPYLEVVPTVAGRALSEIPFIFINAADLVVDPGTPPLLRLSNLDLTVWRGEADYRHTLFMQGQETLCLIGQMFDDETEAQVRLGASSVLKLPIGGDAKYVGIGHEGLSEQRLAIAADIDRGKQMGGELLDRGSREKESGDALRVRVDAQTATLGQIATAGALGLERALKLAAQWVGADPDQVSVIPNLDFGASAFTAKDLLDLMTAKQMGAPLSLQSIHDWLRRKDLTNLTLAEELALVEDEEPFLGGASTATGAALAAEQAGVPGFAAETAAEVV